VAAYPGYTLEASLPGYEAGSVSFDLSAPVDLNLELAHSHYYVSAAGNDGWAGTEAAPFLTLEKAIQMANESVNDRHVIVLGTLNRDHSQYPSFSIWFLQNSREITIRGKGALQDYGDGTYSAQLTVYENGYWPQVGEILKSKIRLKDIAITGGKDTGLVVAEGSEVVLENCVIADNGWLDERDDGPYGGGIYIYDSIVTMIGGVIRNNMGTYGGGVYIGGDSKFIMEDSSIEYNTAYSGGGVMLYNTGEFIMRGGQIVHNLAISNRSGYASGGGISSGNYWNNWPTTITITGGLIAYNEATYGGGIFLCNGTDILLSGSRIAGNTAQRGGGVYSNQPLDVSTLMEPGSVIYGKDEGANSNSAASDGNGHAVWYTSSASGVDDTIAP
ncbi:MAG: right-handed parallel beta-helix repeat-containing protein, partial [Spirochaetaceae bacterium]|nr:right-handed parallel beta-helix repeat-containing protein [Spirochaetaceae bacterium]